MYIEFTACHFTFESSQTRKNHLKQKINYCTISSVCTTLWSGGDLQVSLEATLDLFMTNFLFDFLTICW